MTWRVLVAVEDSPGSLAALDVALELAVTAGARVRAVHVVPFAESERHPAAGGRQDFGARRHPGVTAVLEHAARAAGRRGVEVETVAQHGEPARCILREASAWGADLVVIGRSAEHLPGRPYVGTHTRHVLEFAEQPVLVVPRVVATPS